MEETQDITINVPYMMNTERTGRGVDETYVFNPDDFEGMEYEDVADQIMLEDLLRSHRAFWGIKQKALIKPK